MTLHQTSDPRSARDEAQVAQRCPALPRRVCRFSLFLALLLCSASALLAQPLSLPLEFRQSAALFNYQSQGGVPLSTVSNVPPGSNGRMPTGNESGSALLPTINQFAGLISFGGLPGLTSNAWQTAAYSALLQGTNEFSG